ncbi:MAG: GGDEF domain-containing protein [Clostridia bacterium]|nr:GGDEF domain-containing protein [Clostridia bacterium]
MSSVNGEEVDRLLDRLAGCLEELRAAVAALREEAVRDSLTGLYNRRYMEQYLGREIERARRYGHEVAVIVMDVDDFKGYNDTHGHLAGDDLLRQYGEVLAQALRQPDVVARWGGEEFVAVLPETGSEGALRTAERLRGLLRAVGPCTVSVGVAVFPADGADAKQVLACADRALYRAKAAGKDRVSAATARAAVSAVVGYEAGTGPPAAVWVGGRAYRVMSWDVLSTHEGGDVVRAYTDGGMFFLVRRVDGWFVEEWLPEAGSQGAGAMPG